MILLCNHSANTLNSVLGYVNTVLTNTYVYKVVNKDTKREPMCSPVQSLILSEVRNGRGMLRSLHEV
jgi:hypothetical protein